MRKVLPYLGAALSTLAMVWSRPAVAQEPFKDLDPNHWAYQAVKDLQEKGIVIGYPNGYFAGKRTLTRYEFAVAIQRLLNKIGAGEKGEQGPQGEAGPAGPAGTAGTVNDEQLQEIRRLLDEFKAELASLGTDVRAARSRIDALAADVADIKNRLDKMIQFSGDAFFGFRSDRSRFGFSDYSGAGRGPNPSHFDNVSSPHDFHLGIKGKLAGGVTANVDLVSSNYLDYRRPGGSGSVARGGGMYGGGYGSNALAGGPFANPNDALKQQTTLYQAALNIPIAGIGSNTVLTIGRYKNQVTPLTFWRPDYDAYFDLPWYDDGNYVQDGFKVTSKFGSATTTLWAASHNSLVGNTRGTLDQPLFGSTGTSFTGKPTGISGIIGAQAATQSAGLHIGIPLFKMGELGFTLIDLSSGGEPFYDDGYDYPYGRAGGSSSGPSRFNNAVIYGANLKLKDIGRFRISAEGAKSVTQRGIDTPDGQDNEDNNAYVLNVGWGSGPVDIAAGYQYIDPRFNAPGYWNKIGNWYNPTNVRGPFVRVGYAFSPSIHVHLGGDFLEGARNRASTGGGTIADNLQRVNAGVNWRINKTFSLIGDYEGVFWDLSPASSASERNSKPIEQYITIGAGVNLTGNTILKLAYQIINMQDVGGGFTGTPGESSNATVFTTQVAVHF